MAQQAGLAEQIKDEMLNYGNLVHAISGATGGVTAITAFYPLNIIRMRVQVDETMKSASVLALAQKIAQDDGVAALYQGWWSSKWACCYCRGVRACSFFPLLLLLPSADRSIHSSLCLALAGVVSLGASNFVSE
jgi:adenine nucleotide transporter 17